MDESRSEPVKLPAGASGASWQILIPCDFTRIDVAAVQAQAAAGHSRWPCSQPFKKGNKARPGLVAADCTCLMTLTMKGPSKNFEEPLAALTRRSGLAKDERILQNSSGVCHSRIPLIGNMLRQARCCGTSQCRNPFQPLANPGKIAMICFRGLWRREGEVKGEG